MPSDQQQKDIHKLALRIRQRILEAGIHNLDASDLALIWREDHEELSTSEKRMHVKNFALQFGFSAMMDSELSRVVFMHAN